MKGENLSSEILTKKITNHIFNKKGYDVIVLDLKNIASFTDYFVICSADSDTQVKAIAEEVEEELRKEGIKCWHREGLKALNWVLLDYVDVVVHVFHKDARAYYSIEKLWGDAPSVLVKDTKTPGKASSKK